MNDVTMAFEPARLWVSCSEELSGPEAAEILDRHCAELFGGRWRRGASSGPALRDVDSRRLEETISRAREGGASERVRRLARYQVVEVPRGLPADEVADALRRVQGVEWVAVEPVAVPTGVDYAQNPGYPQQNHVQPAPLGINPVPVWSATGGDGTGVRIVDVEWDWRENHPQLSQMQFSIRPGIRAGTDHLANHGMATLGILATNDDTVDGVGIVPNASVIAAPLLQSVNGTVFSDYIGVFVGLAMELGFGDVVVSPTAVGSAGGHQMAPDFFAPYGDAVELCVSCGIVVLFGAGNDAANYDTELDDFGKASFNPASPDFVDTGSIIVGGTNANRTKWPDSAYGARIDCHAEADGVYNLIWDSATGTAAGSLPGAYNGTSAAVAIVGAGVAALQGAYQAAHGSRLSPAQIRQLLGTVGTPSADPAQDRIGLQPDLGALLAAAGGLSSIYIRDNAADQGLPATGLLSRSPDIILRTASEPDPTGAWGPGSGHEADDDLSEQIPVGSDSFVYLRALNAGDAAATNVTGEVYWALPSALASPLLWQDKIGAVTFPDIPPGRVVTLSSELPFDSSGIGIGHYCLVAMIGSPGDPAPTKQTFADWDRFRQYIRQNRNVAWRNFDVVPMPPDAPSVTVPLWIAGAEDRGLEGVTLQTVGRLPRGAKVEIRLERSRGVEVRRRRGRLTRLGRREPLLTLDLAPGALVRADVQLRVPYRRGATYDIAIAQGHEGEQLGARTWRVVCVPS